MNNSSPTKFNFIGENTEVSGDLIIKGDTHIYGKIRGNISTSDSSNIIIEYTGQVEGNITGLNIVVKGQLLGNIIGANKVEATSTAKIQGSIASKQFQIYPGAKIVGDIQSSKELSL